jgi:DNA (cytosine-5)-methyltransferase 1
LAAVDIDEQAAKTYRSNFCRYRGGPAVLSGDAGNLASVDPHSIYEGEEPDVLIGGPPCQGFSRVGRSKLDSLSEEGHEADPRNQLYLAFMKAAKKWRPKAIIIENVPGMLSVDSGGTDAGDRDLSFAEQAASDLVARGYRAGFAVLNAVRYGVPQYRDRLFFVGIRKDLGIQPSLPPTTHRAVMPSGYMTTSSSLFLPFDDLHHDLQVDTRFERHDATTVEDAIGDLPPILDHIGDSPRERGNFRQKRPFSPEQATGYRALMRSWPKIGRVPSNLVDHVSRRTPRDYEIFRRMEPGDRYSQAIVHAKAIFAEYLEIARTRSYPKKGTPQYEARKFARDHYDEHFRQLALVDGLPAEGTDEFEELCDCFVPPYPEHKFKDKWHKLIPSQPSWTVVAHLAKDAYSHIHYSSKQARSISVREAARLQSFPDGFRFEGNMGDCFRQIGNAVPPLLAWAMASHVLEILRLPHTKPPF